MAEENALKVVVVGDEGCGKSSLLYVYCNNEFQEIYIPTILESYEKVTDLGNILSIYDTPGSDDLARLRPLLYHKADVVLICFAVDAPDTLKSCLDKWLKEVKLFCPETPYILVGCKKDLRHDFLITYDHMGQAPVTIENGSSVAKMMNSLGYVECSAKLQLGIHELFEMAIASCLYKKFGDSAYKKETSEKDSFEVQFENLILETKNAEDKSNFKCDHCLESAQQVLEMNEQMDKLLTRISFLETRVNIIENKSTKNLDSVENCLFDFASGLTMTSLNNISKTLTSLESSLPYVDKNSVAISSPSYKRDSYNISKEQAQNYTSNDLVKNVVADSSPSYKRESYSIPKKQAISYTLSNDIVKKVLDNQSRLSSLICVGLEESQDDLRIVKNFACQLRLNPITVISCNRLGPKDLNNRRDLKIRFVSPEVAQKFFATPKYIITSQYKYKDISFLLPWSKEEEKEADELRLTIKSLR